MSRDTFYHKSGVASQSFRSGQQLPWETKTHTRNIKWCRD